MGAAQVSVYVCACVDVDDYRIALKFRGSKFSQILRITGHSRNYFNENFDTCCVPTATWTVFQRTRATASLMALFVYFNRMDSSRSKV